MEKTISNATVIDVIISGLSLYLYLPITLLSVMPTNSNIDMEIAFARKKLSPIIDVYVMTFLVLSTILDNAELNFPFVY